MTKQNNKQPAPKLADTATDADAGNVTPISRKADLKAGIANAWDIVNRETSAAQAEAATLKQDIRQKLAETADLAKTANADAEELTEKSGEVAALLYQARAKALLSVDEMNAMLGDNFGFKVKGDAKAAPVPAGHAKASKTPAGQGEAIRKRVVRAVDARAYVTSKGEEATRFFEGLPIAQVQPLVEAVDRGERSVFMLYHDLASIASENSTGRLPALHDAKQIAKLASMALEAETIALAVKSPAIRAAMAELYRSIGIAGQMVAEGMNESEAA